MKTKDLKKFIPINVDDLEVDPAVVTEHHFFNSNSTHDYRKESINFLNKNRISFHTTPNSSHTFATLFIQVKCPKCKKILKGGGGGGSTNRNHIDFHCKTCKLSVSITTPDDGYSVSYND